jgi:Tol biopolymer transport system component
MSYYQLQVEGAGVSFSQPTPVSTPVAATATAPARVQSKPTAASGLTGRLVFQTAYGGDFYTINADGSALLRITSGTDPVWSPDGSQIAFTRWQEPRGVWVVDADGSNERRLFDWPRETSYPSWSQDGTQIVFARQHRGRLEEMERCAVRGSKLFCFTIPPNPHYNLGVVGVSDGSFWEPLPSGSERSLAPDWSPAGGEVVYADVYGLFVQSTDGQARYQLTNNNKDINPVWSPDGGQVAFTRRQHDHWEIYVVDADGGNLKRLSETPALPNGAAGNSVSPAWSPDGHHIAFLTDRTGKWEMWVMGSDGSNQHLMFETALDSLKLEYAFRGERGISWTQ